MCSRRQCIGIALLALCTLFPSLAAGHGYGSRGGSLSGLTTNTVPKATSATQIGNSLLTDDGTTLTYSGTGGFSTGGASAGIIDGLEGTGQAASAAGHFSLIGDSSTHTFKVSLNGGSYLRVGTTSGTLTSGNCAKFDASGNIVDHGAACSGGAPTTAAYVTTQAEAGLSSEVSLGALADNAIVAVDVAASVATPRAAVYTDIVPLWASGSCSGYLKHDGTCSTSSDTNSIVIVAPQPYTYANPSANTTYEIFGEGVLPYPPSGRGSIVIPVSGTITKVYWNVYSNGDGTTGQTVTHRLYVNRSPVGSGVAFDYDTNLSAGSETMSVSVSAGDTVEWVIVTPTTWTSTATGVRPHASLLMTIP